MNTKKTPSEDESLQGGYGSPTPEDEMPDSKRPASDALSSSGINDQTLSEKPESRPGRAQDTDEARGYREDGTDPFDDGSIGPHPGEASNDPLLDPVVPTGKDPETAAVSEADLNKARTIEPPD